MIWNETKKRMSRDEMTNLQSTRLRKLVNRMYHSVEYYRKKMWAVGLEPGDTRGIEDLEKLPFTTKDDLKDTYPLGMFAVSDSQITRIHASSGTTGEATVMGYIRKDIDVWSECVARCITMAGLGSSDIIQVAYRYGLFTGGLGAHYGAERMGATVAPMSTGDTKKLITMMVDFRVMGVMCTSSYLLYIAETIEEMGVKDKIKLKASINGVEPRTEKMRTQIERQLGIHAHDIYDLNEIMGSGVITDCQFHGGFHIYEDHLPLEIADQNTLKLLRSGMTGELVTSTLIKEGPPLIHYRIKDLTSLDHSTRRCGRTTARTARFTGRTDDMLIIRGINIFPSQIGSALLEMGGITPHYLLIVDRVNNLDTLEVQAEVEKRFLPDETREPESLTGETAYMIRQAIGLTVKVKPVESKSIRRSVGKTKRVIDKRNLN